MTALTAVTVLATRETKGVDLTAIDLADATERSSATATQAA
jgi:hypothetical protein